MSTVPAEALAEALDDVAAVTAAEEVAVESEGDEGALQVAEEVTPEELVVTDTSADDDAQAGTDEGAAPAAAADDEETAEPPAGNDATDETVTDEGAQPEQEAAEPAADEEGIETEAVEDDPLYFQDLQTGKRVTTLHTSGTYLLVDADGSPYTGYLSSVTFDYMGADPRGNEGSYQVDLKTVDNYGGSGESVLVLEDLKDGDGWQLPSGSYTVAGGSYLGHTNLKQTYRVVNDGLYWHYFDLSDSVQQDSLRREFSIKGYNEDTTDLEYDGGLTDEGYYVSPTVPEQDTFVLAADTRLRFEVNSTVSMNGNTMPQIESISLWKADEALETLVGTFDDAGELVTEGKYVDLYEALVSRVPELLQEGGVDAVPTWPSYLNFGETEKLTTLWERGDASLNERIELDATDVENGQCTSTSVIIDQVSFANSAVEDGVYFPIVKATIAGESYTYAYYPIEVAAEEDVRGDPRITTSALPAGRVGDAYTITLKAQSGSIQEGTFSWAVTEGTLPEGLSLEASTGIILGTPAAEGTANFTVTLTETVGGEDRTTMRSFSLRVREAAVSENAFDRLSLGEIGYTPGTIWTSGVYNKATYTTLRIPISLDIRDERYNLGETELWYMLKMTTKYDDGPHYRVWHDRAVDLMNADGTALEVAAPVEKGLLLDPLTLTRIRAFLVPKTNNGDYAFDPGQLENDGTYSDGTPYRILPIEVTLSERYGAESQDAVVNEDGYLSETQSYVYMSADGSSTSASWYGDYAYYNNAPEMPHTALENPDITFGSWISIPELELEGDAAYATDEGRVRLWACDGTTTVGEPQVRDLSTDAVFKLKPGTYALTVEGLVPSYDENGVEIEDADVWIDVVGKVSGASVLKGTYPKQYVFSVGPNEGTKSDPLGIDVTYSYEGMSDVNRHSVSPTFEMTDGTYANSRDAGVYGYVQYEVRWYRRVGQSDPAKDVLVATGDTVVFGRSDYDLYVEVVPTGRDNAFWKAKKLKVSQDNKVVQVKLERKQRFTGTFTLSCVSGKVPAGGTNWGIIEVSTITDDGGISTYNLWAGEATVSVPNLTSGATVTFTPIVDLKGGEVSYTVPEEAEENFTAELVAPLAKGVIDFEGLHFVDVNGKTTDFTLNDGHTGVKVQVGYAWDEGIVYYDEVPSYVLDGGSILLQPELYEDEPQFMRNTGDTFYRVTVTHKDPDAPDYVGTMTTDVAASESFDIGLSREVTSATIKDTTFLSRGYALVPINKGSRKLANVALFRTTLDEEGTITSAESQDKASSAAIGDVDVLRTPFLDAGTYAFYAVYADSLGGDLSLENFSDMERVVRDGQGSRIDFEIEDGTITDCNTTSFRSSLWSWAGSASEDKGLVNKDTSFVNASIVYRGMTSIEMRAELASGVTLSDSARLEIRTNQASGDSGAGYTHPRALTINGKPLVINRWENLFNGTQNMDEGNLTILLSEAKKQGAECASFPMDLTLVVPRNSATSTIDASVWLVDGGKRTLVGTCHEVYNQTDLVVPSYVAWKTFYVYGSTSPNANVTVFMDGMRAATACADNFGYYSAEITLPYDVRNNDSFSLTASAQWATADSITHAATTESHEVIYTEAIPVVERITAYYQSMPGDPYTSVVSYYRGMMPDKYRRIYRAENEGGSSTGEHAMQFWMVEFANPKGVCDVSITVPFASGDVTMETTDKIATAKSWIPDVKNASTGYSYAGQEILDGLSATEPHGFVSKPTYFATAPTEIMVNSSLDIEAIRQPGFETVVDIGSALGAFEGYQAEGMAEDIEGYLGKMSDSGYLHILTDAEVAQLTVNQGTLVKPEDLPDVSATAQTLLTNAAGCADDWVLLGPAKDATSGEDALLLLHHTAQTTAVSQDAISSEVQGLVDGTQTQRDLCAPWFASGTAVSEEDLAEAAYAGNNLVYAIDGTTEGVDDPSCLYNIITEDNAGNVQWETLNEYVIYGSGKHYYTFQRMDKQSMRYVTWDEEYGRRVDVSYTIHPNQVRQSAVGFYDLYLQWNTTLLALHRGIDEGLGYTEDDTIYGEVEDDVLIGQSTDDGALGSDESSLATQGFWGEAGGYLAGDSIKYGLEQICKQFGIKSTDENMQDANTLNEQINNPEFRMQRTAIDGNQSWIVDGMKTIAARQTVNNVSNTAYNYVSSGRSAFGIATLFIPVSPTQEAVEAVSSGKGWPTNKKKATTTKPKKRKRPQTEKEWKEEYWRQAIAREMGWEYDMTIFFELDKTTLKHCVQYFERNLKQNLPDLWRKYELHKRVHDPSGFVYEAVLSNVVEGATVKLYTYNPAAAEAGFDDPSTFVDSEQFGLSEENPQVTGADGRYQWFVPEGFWQVRVSKTGYESFSTGEWGHKESHPVYGEDGEPVLDEDGAMVAQAVWVGDYGIGGTKDFDGDGEDDAAEYWMPVLPVQLDVNIPLVSYEEPTIETIEAGEDGVTVTFSKYMKVDTVTADLFSIDGEQAPSCTPVDEEAAADGSGQMLATTFKLSYPDSTELVVGFNRISVTFDDENSVATSYAGVPADDYATKTVYVTIENIDISQASIAAIPAQTYTGKAIKPAITVTYGGKTLVAGTDYTVTYSDNVNVGNKATVTVTGTGDFAGTKSATFRIAFKDVRKGAWYYNVVHRANDLGLMNGYGGARAGNFGPNDNIRRCDVAVILWNMAGKPAAGTGAKSFDDVKSGAYYYAAVRWASSVGVVSGGSDGTFRPTDDVTREELASMLRSYYVKVAGRTAAGSAADFASMPDASKVSIWARSGVGFCFRNRIISGKDGLIAPKATATRAETAKMVVFLYDMLNA